MAFDNEDLSVDEIVRVAHEEFERTTQWYQHSNKMFLNDWKFHNADSENNYQWPDDIRRDRDIDAKPSLTINQARQYNLQLINWMLDNRPDIVVKPTGDGATKASADVWEGIIRRITYQSKFGDVLEAAVVPQVAAGKGYWRVCTDWESDKSFNQNIYLRAIPDPLSVRIDPDCVEKDKRDAKFAFIFNRKLKKEIEKKYPQLKGKVGQTPLGFAEAWVDKDYCIEAEYWKKEEIEDVLYETQNGAILKSALPEELWQKLELNNLRKRKVIRERVMWYLIVGDIRVDEKEWLGKFIPLIQVTGEEFVVDGLYDSRGHTRAMLDPQRMYNYWVSSAVEQVALQGKIPWVACSAAVEGYEVMWANANTENYSVLTYNGFGDDGVTPIEKPSRADPPVMADAYVKGMEIARQELMLVSGQNEAAMGQADNSRTGAALQGKQSRSDTATSHFMRNLASSMMFTGEILLDLVPKIYDVERVLRILHESGDETAISIDPEAKQLMAAQEARDQEGVKLIFNPKMGEYSVEADIGPGFATKREQSFAAFTQILTQAPELVHLIGDIVLREGDFPGAEDAAERLRRMVPPQALGIGPTQNEQKLTQQLNQANQLIHSQNLEISTAKLKSINKGELRNVEQFNAETKRLETLLKPLMADEGEAEGLRAIIRQMIDETLASHLMNPVVQDGGQAGLTPWGGPPPPAANGTPQPPSQPSGLPIAQPA